MNFILMAVCLGSTWLGIIGGRVSRSVVVNLWKEYSPRRTLGLTKEDEVSYAKSIRDKSQICNLKPSILT